VPIPAVEYETELVSSAHGSELNVTPVAIGELPDGKILVALAEIEGLPERLKLYGGAVPMLLMMVALAEIEVLTERRKLYGGAAPDSEGTVVALAENEGLADGSYDADEEMVPITELAEYVYGLNDDEKGYGPCVG